MIAIPAPIFRTRPMHVLVNLNESELARCLPEVAGEDIAAELVQVRLRLDAIADALLGGLRAAFRNGESPKVLTTAMCTVGVGVRSLGGVPADRAKAEFLSLLGADSRLDESISGKTQKVPVYLSDSLLTVGMHLSTWEDVPQELVPGRLDDIADVLTVAIRTRFPQGEMTYLLLAAFAALALGINALTVETMNESREEVIHLADIMPYWGVSSAPLPGNND